MSCHTNVGLHPGGVLLLEMSRPPQNATVFSALFAIMNFWWWLPSNALWALLIYLKLPRFASGSCPIKLSNRCRGVSNGLNGGCLQMMTRILTSSLAFLTNRSPQVARPVRAIVKGSLSGMNCQFAMNRGILGAKGLNRLLHTIEGAKLIVDGTRCLAAAAIDHELD